MHLFQYSTTTDGVLEVVVTVNRRSLRTTFASLAAVLLVAVVGAEVLRPGTGLRLAAISFAAMGLLYAFLANVRQSIRVSKDQVQWRRPLRIWSRTHVIERSAVRGVVCELRGFQSRIVLEHTLQQSTSVMIIADLDPEDAAALARMLAAELGVDSVEARGTG